MVMTSERIETGHAQDDGALFLSRSLQDLLLWLIKDDFDVHTLEEIITKPWQYEDWARAHRKAPGRSAGEVIDAR